MRAPLAPNTSLSIKDAAELTGFSRNTIIRIFEKEPGVLTLNRPEKMHKRGYRTIRIPRAVFERVVERLSVQESYRSTRR